MQELKHDLGYYATCVLGGLKYNGDTLKYVRGCPGKYGLMQLMTMAPVMHGDSYLSSGQIVNGNAGSVTIDGNNSHYYGAGPLSLI